MSEKWQIGISTIAIVFSLLSLFISLSTYNLSLHDIQCSDARNNIKHIGDIIQTQYDTNCTTYINSSSASYNKVQLESAIKNLITNDCNDVLDDLDKIEKNNFCTFLPGNLYTIASPPIVGAPSFFTVIVIVTGAVISLIVCMKRRRPI